MPYDPSIYTKAYFERGSVENQFFERRELRLDQLAAIRYATEDRTPKHILSVGVGQGFLEAQFVGQRIKVTGQDVRDNRHPDFKCFPMFVGRMDVIPEDDYDTIIFCESIEHIEDLEFDRNWPRLCAMLTKTGGLFIVTNWEEYHPLPVNDWDHIRRIDDALYDRLQGAAKQMNHRKGSHLVLQF